MIAFPCVAIGIDTQGGGHALIEGLSDKDKMRPEHAETAILPIIEDKKDKETDKMPGQHIIHPINFASAEWNSEANHTLRKDMQDKFLLFPEFNQLTLAITSRQDEIKFKELRDKVGETQALKSYDTLEDSVMDIEELKMELSTITVSRTPSGREKFDTPEVKLGTGKKGRMRKDRYSALLIANMIARNSYREIPKPTYNSVGTVIGEYKIDKDQPMYVGNKIAKGYSMACINYSVRR
jgi:hypothetical protein